jgi:hypothetical protein
MLIISIDVDVGSKTVGTYNKGRNDRNVHNYLSERTIGEIEETALPLFIELFEKVEMPATFAVRGQMLKIDSKPVECLTETSVQHDIGAHGFSHKMFTKMSGEEADHELEMLSALMKEYNTTPTSFIFPRNGVAHLDVLERYGYKTYRSYGNLWLDCMRIEKTGNLYNIRPSLFLDQSINATLLKGILKIAILKRAPFHVWFHLWNFGKTKTALQRSLNRVMLPFLRYAQQEVSSGSLSFETMASAHKKVEPYLAINRRKTKQSI